MLITQLEKLDKSKVKVYIDGEYAFLLYQKDVNRYQLVEGNVISDELHYEIIEETVFRRAKQKALAILKHMDRTEYELRKKLGDAGYQSEIIERTITYINQYGYLNDERFASTYIRTKKNYKSKMLLRSELLQKGISKDIINQIFMDEYEEEGIEDPEVIALQKAISKKTKNVENLTHEERQKLMASLYRKGFGIDKIKLLL